MPSLMSALRILAATASTFSTLALGINLAPNDPTQHGLSIFYKIVPTDTQVAAFASGHFDTPPPSSYECSPDPDYPFHPPSFSCYNPRLATKETTPQDIYNYGNPAPACLTLGIAFEHLQWATWTHACWEHPNPAIDTPTGHAEAAFQSSAIAFRRLVLYQHDKHILKLNLAIAELRFPVDVELKVMRDAVAAPLAAIDTYYDAQIEALPKWGSEHNVWFDELNEQREAKKAVLKGDMEAAVAAREALFWQDSWQYRNKTVEIDHLVGEYFEAWMSGRLPDEWDWAGMGLPEPAWPDEGHST